MNKYKNIKYKKKIKNTFHVIKILLHLIYYITGKFLIPIIIILQFYKIAIYYKFL